MWRDGRVGRERGRVWDDRGPSYCIIPRGLVWVVTPWSFISVKESRPPESDSQRYEPSLAQSSLSPAFCWGKKKGERRERRRLLVVVESSCTVDLRPSVI